MAKKQNAEMTPEAYKAHIREIKDVLFGNVVMREDKRLAVSRPLFGNPWGLEDGAPEIFLFGVLCKTYVYEAPFREYTRSRFAISKMLEEIGKALYLETAPDRAACLMKHLFFRPVVLEFGERTDDNGEQELVLYAYSGRTLFSVLSITHAVKAFEKNLPVHVHRKETAAKHEGKTIGGKDGKAQHRGKDRKP